MTIHTGVMLQTDHDGWDVDTVTDLLSKLDGTHELAMYIDGDVVTFIGYPLHKAPDEGVYGKLIETWYCI